jgi:hypothetical protein
MDKLNFPEIVNVSELKLKDFTKPRKIDLLKPFSVVKDYLITQFKK